MIEIELSGYYLETKKLIHWLRNKKYNSGKRESAIRSLRLQVNNYKIIFREAKTTPTKNWSICNFVENEFPIIPIEPFQDADDFTVIIKTKTNVNGLFVFSKRYSYPRNYFNR
jgi:hypothetical protein